LNLRRARLALVAASLVAGVALLFGAELVCRMLVDLPYLGNSRNLLVPKAWGDSRGNAKSIEGNSFGVTVYTDRNGFRVPAAWVEPYSALAPAVLILGDSVAFGSGVAESETVAGRLRVSLPYTPVLNSAVIGYATWDYENFLRAYLPRGGKVERAYLVFCLNDVTGQSAQRLDEQLAAAPERVSPLRWLNEYLRPRSKLFLWVKQFVRRPVTLAWNTTWPLYAEDAPVPLETQLAPVVAAAALLEEQGAPLTVVLSPYAYQVVHRDEDTAAPQRALVDFFRSKGITVIDALDRFRSQGEGRDLFLPGDAMHLSAAGHALLHAIILDDLRAQRGHSAFPDLRPGEP
jgi:hypothetical protein